MNADRLSGYPFVILRVACMLCPRAGAYRIVRLAAMLGPEASLEEVVAHVSRDCPYRHDVPRRRERKYVPDCKAYLCDLGPSSPPPDLPPGMAGLRVIEGGKLPVPEGGSPPRRRARRV